MGKRSKKNKGKQNSKGNDEMKLIANSEQEKNDATALESQSPELLKFDEKIIEIDDEIKSLEKKSKDALAKKSKLESDRQNFEKKLKSEKDILQQTEYELNKLGDKFVYKPEPQKSSNDGGLGKMLKGSNKKDGRKEQEKDEKSSSFPSIPLPKEDLPTVGKIYTDNNQRFLEIAYGEEVEEGKKQAEYFKAKLVVKETV